MGVGRGPRWKAAGRLARLGVELVASAVTSYEPLSFRGHGAPPFVARDPEVRADFEVEGASEAVAVCASGSGHVEVEGRLWYAVDCVNCLAPLPPRRARASLVLTRRGFGGGDPGFLYVKLAGRVAVSWPLLRLGLRVLHLAALARQGLVDPAEAEEELRGLDVEAEPWQLAVAHHVLGCDADPMCPRRGLAPPSFVRAYVASEGLRELGRRLEAPVPRDLEAEASRLYRRLARLAAPARRGVRVHIVFYSHLDTPWLWSLEWSVRRARAQAATMRALYTVYPELKVPYHPGPRVVAEWARDLMPPPERLAPLCSLLVEPDLWLVPGDLLVHAALACRGARLAWLPDSFGYPASLPKILRLAGVAGVVVHKIMWNDTERPRVYTFRWVGDDGSAVTAVVLHESYTGDCSPASIARYAEAYRGSARDHVYSCGPGDSGSPPGLEHAEGAALAVEAGIAVPLDVDALLEGASVGDAVAGDLYLEYHRGAYTTDPPTKALVWRVYSLALLRDLVAAARGEAGGAPWDEAALLAFHDTVSGTLSADARRSVWGYALGLLRRLRVGARGLEALGNTLLWRAGLAAPAPGGYTVYAVDGLTVGPPEAIEVPVRAQRGRVELGGASVKLEGPELELPGVRVGLELTVHHDRPHEWDAWEVDEYSLAEGEPQPLEAAAAGRHAVLRASGPWGRATLVARPLGLRRGLLIDAYVELARRGRLVKLWLRPSGGVEAAWRGVPYGVSPAPLLEERPSHYEQPLTWLAARSGEGLLAVAALPPRGVTVSRRGLGVSLARLPGQPNPRLPAAGHVRLAVAPVGSVAEAAQLAEELARPPQPAPPPPGGRAVRVLEVEATAPVVGSLRLDGGRALLTLMNPGDGLAAVTVGRGDSRFAEARGPDGRPLGRLPVTLELGPRELRLVILA